MRNFKIGEWVKAESHAGELIHGYIENINSVYGTVKVKVIASDNAKTIGKTIEVTKRVESLPIAVPKTEEEIIALIDLALSTKDKEWFIELTGHLNSIANRSKQKPVVKNVYSFMKNEAVNLEKKSENERG